MRYYFLQVCVRSPTIYPRSKQNKRQTLVRLKMIRTGGSKGRKHPLFGPLPLILRNEGSGNVLGLHLGKKCGSVTDPYNVIARGYQYLFLNGIFAYFVSVWPMKILALWDGGRGNERFRLRKGFKGAYTWYTCSIISLRQYARCDWSI